MNLLQRLKEFIFIKIKKNFFWLSERAERENSRNIEFELLRRSLKTSVDYIIENMWHCPRYSDRNKFHKEVLESVEVDGLFLEFGTASGATLNRFAKWRPEKKFFGFDSFKGLPETWVGPNMLPGTFKQDKLPTMRSNVDLVIGYFDESLVGFLEKHPEKVAFIHLDADLYSSTRYVLDHIYDRFQPGTVVLFDEYFNYPNWENDGEFKAWQEIVKEKGLKYEYTHFMTGSARRVAAKIL